MLGEDPEPGAGAVGSEPVLGEAPEPGAGAVGSEPAPGEDLEPGAEPDPGSAVEVALTEGGRVSVNVVGCGPHTVHTAVVVAQPLGKPVDVLAVAVHGQYDSVYVIVLVARPVGQM